MIHNVLSEIREIAMTHISADRDERVVQALRAVGQNGLANSIANGGVSVETLRHAFFALPSEQDIANIRESREYFNLMVNNRARGPYLQSRITQLCKALEAVGRPDLSAQMSTAVPRGLLQQACSVLLTDQDCITQKAARDFLRSIRGVAR